MPIAARPGWLWLGRASARGAEGSALRSCVPSELPGPPGFLVGLGGGGGAAAAAETELGDKRLHRDMQQSFPCS